MLLKQNIDRVRIDNEFFFKMVLKTKFICLIFIIGFFLVPIDLSGQHKTEETYYSDKGIKSKGSTYTYPIYYDNKVTGKKHQYFGELIKREKEWKYWFQNGQIERIENYKLIKNHDPIRT